MKILIRSEILSTKPLRNNRLCCESHYPGLETRYSLAAMRVLLEVNVMAMRFLAVEASLGVTMNSIAMSF